MASTVNLLILAQLYGFISQSTDICPPLWIHQSIYWYWANFIASTVNLLILAQFYSINIDLLILAQLYSFNNTDISRFTDIDSTLYSFNSRSTDIVPTVKLLILVQCLPYIIGTKDGSFSISAKNGPTHACQSVSTCVKASYDWLFVLLQTLTLLYLL